MQLDTTDSENDYGTVRLDEDGQNWHAFRVREWIEKLADGSDLKGYLHGSNDPHRRFAQALLNDALLATIPSSVRDAMLRRQLISAPQHFAYLFENSTNTTRIVAQRKKNLNGTYRECSEPGNARNTAANIANTYAMSAEPTKPTGALQDPQNKLLEMQAGTKVEENTEKRRERVAEARGQETRTIEATGNGLATRSSESDSGHTDTNHTNAPPAGTRDVRREVMNTTRKDRGVSEACAHPPHISELISESLEGERGRQISIDCADDEESQDMPDGPDDVADGAGHRMGHPQAHMCDSDAHQNENALIEAVAASTYKKGACRDDSTALPRPNYLQSHLGEDKRPEIRIQRRLFLEPVGVPLESFSCIQELLSVLIDIVDVHEILVLRCDILHRDISIRNILMHVFNYGKQHWPIRSNDPQVVSRLSERDKIIQERNFRRGLLIDFDYAKFIDEDSVISGGERTDTIPFMALDILALDILHPSGSGGAVNVTREPRHDLESIVYVLVWICVLYSNPKSPEHQPLHAHDTCLRQWTTCRTRADVETLYSTKMGELITRLPLRHFTPYFRGLAPFVHRLYAHLATQSPLTYDFLRNVLLDAFFEVQEPSTDFTYVWNLGATVPEKRKTELEMRTTKRSRH